MADHIRNLIQSLSTGDLRQLLSIKESQAEIEKLIQKRNSLLAQADQIQRQVDELILSRCRSNTGRRLSYGKRTGPTIRQMCEEIMLGMQEPLSAAEVKNRILERWPEREAPTLYNQIFIALGRSEHFKKVRKGRFALKEGARKAIEEAIREEEAEGTAPADQEQVGGSAALPDGTGADAASHSPQA